MRRRDNYTVKAKKEGLRARSAYKLIELNNKYHFLEGADHILDLGCWPGGWSLVASEYASVTSVDLKSMKNVKNCKFIQADLFDERLPNQLPEADVVISDAAPNTAGNSLDAYKSFLLAMRTLEIAVKRLRPRGSFVCKIFQGEDYEEFRQNVMKYFEFAKTTKPKSSRKQSKEMFMVAMRFKEGSVWSWTEDDW